MSKEIVRDLVMAAHGDLDKVKALVAEHADLIDIAHEWRPGMTESPLEAASHTGGRAIAEHLLESGAKPIIVAAAMLGDQASFEALLSEEPTRIREKGAHNFSLMFHAALGGNLAIAERIYSEVGDEGIESAMLASVMAGQHDMAKWLIEKGVSLENKDFKGRTALEYAVEIDDTDMISILQDAIGEDNLPVCDNCGEKGTKYLAEMDGSPMGGAPHTKYFRCKACGHDMETVKVG